MAVYKNTASQKIAVYAYDVTTGAAKTGDAANITGYISKDWGAAAAITDTNPTELDATNMPGWYVFDLTQAETNAEVIVVAPKSATANVVLDQVQIVTADSLVATAAALATVDTVVDAILLDTAEIGAAGAGLTAVPWNAAWDAEVQSEATDALNAYDPPTKAELDTAVSPLATAAALTTHDGKLDTVDGIVDAILVDTNELQTNQGNWLTATGFSTHSAADVWAVATRVLTANTNLNDPTAAAIADAILDELTSGHTTAGTVGKALTDILADTDELQTNQGNWLTATGFSTHDAAAVVTALESTQLPDSTPAVGARPTWGQALLGASRFMMEKEVTGATLTVYKEDGTTAVMTFTLDDGDAPTSITRAS